MHRKPYSKQRYIAASHYCTTKPLSQILTKCLKVIERQHRMICRGYLRNYGFQSYINAKLYINAFLLTIVRRKGGMLGLTTIFQLCIHPFLINN